MIQILLSVAAANPTTADLMDAGPDDRGEAPVIAGGDEQRAFIINGDSADKDDWPMAGGMLLTGDLTYQGFEFEQTAVLCSSTLIAPDVVLLAAHCIDLDALTLQLDPSGSVEIRNPELYWTRKVDLSAYQLGAPPANLPADAVRAKAYVGHNGFSLFGMQLGLAENKDIALLFLEEPILDVPLGYLPQRDTAETEMQVGADLVVVGWGQQTATQQGQQPPPGSYGVKMMGTSHVAEKAPYEFKVGEVMSDVRKCHGDSGGPSFMQVETDSSEVYRVVGVTSHSYDFSDCSTTGGVDTRVSHYLDWIENKMTAACEDGTRVWCDIPGLIPPPAADGTLAWEVPEEPEAKGCSTAGTTGAVGWLALGALALIRRR